MNSDLIAGLLTVLTMYSTFITYKYFQVRRQSHQIKIQMAMQELANACESMANLFSGMAEESKKKEESETEENLDEHEPK